MKVGTAGMAVVVPGQQLSPMVLVLTLLGSCKLSIPECERHLIHGGFYSPSLGVLVQLRASFLVIVSTPLHTNIGLAGFRSLDRYCLHFQNLSVELRAFFAEFGFLNDVPALG